MKDIKDIHITIENGRLEIELDHNRIDLSNIIDMDIHLDCNVKMITINKHELMFMRQMITSLKFEIWGFKKSPKNKKGYPLTRN